MKCYQCKEQIEVGEACRTEYLVGSHQQFFHTGCHVTFREEREQGKRQEAHLQAMAQLTRTVC